MQLSFFPGPNLVHYQYNKNAPYVCSILEAVNYSAFGNDAEEIGRKGLRQKFHTLKLVSLPRNPTYSQLHGDLSKHKLKSSYHDFQHYKPELEERVFTFSIVFSNMRRL